jgi:hypothetical protein
VTSSRRHDLFTGPTHTYLAWEHDSRVTLADNTSGAFRSHTFATPGDYPSVAASSGKVFVTWGGGRLPRQGDRAAVWSSRQRGRGARPHPGVR